jgi:hypothetical protein
VRVVPGCRVTPLPNYRPWTYVAVSRQTENVWVSLGIRRSGA